MDHPDDDRSVDFVVGEPGPGGGDGPADEELADYTDTNRRQRLRIELGGGALALLVVVLVLRASLSPHHPSSTPTPVPAPSFSYSTVTGPELAGPLPVNGKIAVPPSETALPTPASLPKSVPTRRGADPRACPGLRCRDSLVDVPAAVRAAVQTAVPESTVEGVETVRLRGHHRVLWFRSIEARAASEVLEVIIRAPAKGDRSRISFVTSDVGATTTVETSLGPWHVVVRVLDPTGGRGDESTMSRLARDPRLVSN